MPAADEDDVDASGREPRQFALVALCIVAVVAAAFVTPAAASGQSPSGPGFNIVELVRDVLEFLFDDEGSGSEFPPEEGCGVALLDRPVPGSEVTVKVWYDGEPQPRSEVWFNGEYVGRTDSAGEVAGRVPYEKQLRVRVEVPGAATCTFGEPTDVYGSLAAPADPAPGAVSGGPAGAAVAPLAATLRTAPDGHDTLSLRTPAGPARQAANDTADNYTVADDADIWVRGRPLPGATVTVGGAVSGVPMRNATVRVDGEVVGRTDAEGEYRLRIPDDGTERVDVEITRGEFTADGTVRVLRLGVRVVPESRLFPLPGQDATVVVRRGDEPAAGATVRVAGEVVGRTGPAGEVETTLPADPTATVTAAKGGETASASVWVVYSRSGFFGGLLLLTGVVTLGLGYLARGVRGLGYVLGGWVAAGTVFAATVRWGRDGFLAATGAIALLVVAAVLVRKRAVVAAEGTTLAATLRGLARWLLSLAMSVTLGIERVLGRLRAALGGLRDRLAALVDERGPVRGLVAFLGRAARRVATAVRESRRVQAALALVGAVALAAGGYAVGGVPGLLGVLAVEALAGLALALWLRSRRDLSGGEAPVGEGGTGGRPERSPDDARWLRRAWRRVARLVFPRSWRTKTPGEVSRAAIERGAPREPVRRLADAFRAVEYGGQSLTEARREAADAALDAVEARLSDDEEGESR